MSIQIEYSEDKTVRITSDDENPRIYMKELLCPTCKRFTDEEQVVWATPEGVLTMQSERALPYCVNCCPEQPDYDEARA